MRSISLDDTEARSAFKQARRVGHIFRFCGRGDPHIRDTRISLRLRQLFRQRPILQWRRDDLVGVRGVVFVVFSALVVLMPPREPLRNAGAFAVVLSIVQPSLVLSKLLSALHVHGFTVGGVGPPLASCAWAASCTLACLRNDEWW